MKNVRSLNLNPGDSIEITFNDEVVIKAKLVAIVADNLITYTCVKYSKEKEILPDPKGISVVNVFQESNTIYDVNTSRVSDIKDIKLIEEYL